MSRYPGSPRDPVYFLEVGTGLRGPLSSSTHPMGKGPTGSTTWGRRESLLSTSTGDRDRDFCSGTVDGPRRGHETPRPTLGWEGHRLVRAPPVPSGVKDGSRGV